MNDCIWRLNDGEYLNDEIINLMLQVVYNLVPNEDFKKKVVMMNTFFYT